MNDLDVVGCYEQASRCATELDRAASALMQGDKDEKAFRVGLAWRYLARAQTAFGSPAVTHRRIVRLCASALEELEQALVTFETEGNAIEVGLVLRKADRRLKRLEIAQAAHR